MNCYSIAYIHSFLNQFHSQLICQIIKLQICQIFIAIFHSNVIGSLFNPLLKYFNNIFTTTTSNWFIEFTQYPFLFERRNPFNTINSLIYIFCTIIYNANKCINHFIYIFFFKSFFLIIQKNLISFIRFINIKIHFIIDLIRKYFLNYTFCIT